MLSITAEHALRALSELALIKDGEAVLGKDLARSAQIPANYLSKVLWVLRNAGIIDATRGSGGGYRLRQRAAEIRLIQVVELFDHQRPARQCFLGGGRECMEADPCGAHEEWLRVRESYLGFLEKTTLADLAQRSGRNVISAGRQRKTKLPRQRVR